MRINPGKVKFKTVIHNTVDFKLNPCGPFLKVPEKFFALGKPKKLKPYNYELYYSHILDGYEQRFPSYRKFEAHTPVCF